MASSRKKPDESKPRRPAATTPEGRENQLIAKAIDLAEKQLDEGTASAQVITHYLKLGSPREQKERDKLDGEIRLQDAKIESLQSGSRIEELIGDALAAFRSYSGEAPPEESNPDD